MWKSHRNEQLRQYMTFWVEKNGKVHKMGHWNLRVLYKSQIFSEGMRKEDHLHQKTLKKASSAEETFPLSAFLLGAKFSFCSSPPIKQSCNFQFLSVFLNMCSLCGFSEPRGFTFSCQLLDNVAPTASSTFGCLWDPWSLLERERESISFSGRTFCDCEADRVAVKSLEGSMWASRLCLSGPTCGWEAAGLNASQDRLHTPRPPAWEGNWGKQGTGNRLGLIIYLPETGQSKRLLYFCSWKKFSVRILCLTHFGYWKHREDSWFADVKQIRKLCCCIPLYYLEQNKSGRCRTSLSNYFLAFY